MKWLLILAIFSLPWAQVRSDEDSFNQKFVIWKVGDKWRTLFEDKKRGILITRNCFKQLKNPAPEESCLAWKKLLKANDSFMKSSDLVGGKDPGSVICRKQLKGDVLFARNREGHSNTFCSFSDGSMVATGTVAYFGTFRTKEKK